AGGGELNEPTVVIAVVVRDQRVTVEGGRAVHADDARRLAVRAVRPAQPAQVDDVGIVGVDGEGDVVSTLRGGGTGKDIVVVGDGIIVGGDPVRARPPRGQAELRPVQAEIF